MNDGEMFNIKYADICSLLEALSIQVNIRGKFIIQQSELLSGIRQRNTALLEIIEESTGNGYIIQRISELEKKQAALCAQKESVKERVEEIERYEEENKEMETMKTKSIQLIEEMKELERNQEEALVEIKVNEYALSTECLSELETKEMRMEKEIKEVERNLKEIDDKIKSTVKERVSKEKEGLGMKEKLQKIQQEYERQRATHQKERRELKQVQEELIVNLDNQASLKERINQIESEVGVEEDMKSRLR